MIESFAKTAPHVSESAALLVTTTVFPAETPVLTDVPSDFASRIDLFLIANVNLASVILRVKALNGSVTSNIALGVLAANTSLAITYAGAIGQVFDVVVIDAAGPNPAAVNCWAVARP